MKPRTIAILGLTLVALAAAWLAGRATRPAAEPAVGALRKGVEKPTSASSLSPAVALMLADPRAFPKTALALGGNAEFQEAIDGLLPSLENGDTHDALFVLADVWASQDPEAAATWLAALDLGDPRNPFLFSALSRWAAQDPDAAIVWFEKSSDGSRDYLAAALVRGLATLDPDAALKLLVASPASPERSGSVDFLIRAWSAVSLEHAFGKTATLPGPLKRIAIEKLTASLAGDQLEAARAWATSLQNPQDRESARTGIAARWSQTDPVAAITWANGLEDPATRATALGEAATRWARITPLDAGTWVDAHRGKPEADLATRAVAWTTVDLDPDTAFNRVAAITHAPLRDETFEQVGRFWLSREPIAAKRFLESESAMPPSIREKLLESFE